VTNFNLADWRSFVGDYCGNLNLELNLMGQQSGKTLKVDLMSQLAGFSAKFGSNQIDQADIVFSAGAQLNNFTQARLDEYKLQLSHRKETALTVTGNAGYDLKSQEAAAQIGIALSLPKLFAIVAVPEAKVSAGELKLNLQLAQKESRAGTAKTAALDQTLSGTLHLMDLSGQYAAYRFDHFETALDLETQMRGKQVDIRRLSVGLRQAGQAGGGFNLTGDFDLGTQAGRANVALTNLNESVLRTFAASALGDKTLASISIRANASARFDAKGESGVRGNIQVAKLLITDPKNQLPQTPLAADFKFDGLLREEKADVKEFSGDLRLADQPGGGFNVSGRYDLKKQAGQFALKLNDLNQNALGSFIVPALGDTTLASVSISADTTAAYDANGESELKGDIAIKNLLLVDTAGNLPKTPLRVGLHLDGAFGKQVLTLRQFKLDLEPTDRAKNELVLSGRVDLNQPKAISGNLQARADSLDLTHYYELFSGPSKTNTPNSALTGDKGKPASVPTKTSTPPVQTATEPAPVELPLQNFIFALGIGQLYLREIAINDWRVNGKIDDGKVTLNPFELVLNGAPFKTLANLNLGVPGYEYDVTLSAERIPVGPIMNTLQPEKPGQIKGDIIANAKVKGAGVTGVNLRKNLTGHLDLNFTNASLKVVSPQAQKFFAPIGFLLGIPDLASSPLNSVNATAQMGNGKINLTQFNVTSDSFLVNTAGEITIADDLMKSTIDKWPMHLSVPRATAERLRMAPKDAPSGSGFVKLTDFVRVAGTLGEPEAEIDKKSLSSAAARKLAEEAIGKKSPLNLFPK
jgi:hypothetical protein